MELLREDSPLRTFLGTYLFSLLTDGENLLNCAEDSPSYFTDYSFVVFPFAKAYEGFLKDLFFRIGIISEKEYMGRHFRIGRALNPDLERRFRSRESVYDKLKEHCRGSELPSELWDVWKRGRNMIFHYFPENHNKLSLPDAKYLIIDIVGVMEKALRETNTKVEYRAKSFPQKRYYPRQNWV